MQHYGRDDLMEKSDFIVLAMELHLIALSHRYHPQVNWSENRT